MARGRMISKSLSTSQKFASLVEVSPALFEFCHALYPLMVSHSDDFGRLQGDPFTVKHVCYPASPRGLQDFRQALQSMHDVELIVWYSVNSKWLIQIQNFDPHQSGLHKRTISHFPDPPSGKFPEIPSEGKGRELKGTKQEHLDRFERFWAEYPRKVAKDAARKEWLKSSPDPAFTERIIAKVREHKASPQWLKDNGNFIPHARTWLHQKRWEDEAIQAQNPRGGYVPRVTDWDCPHVDPCGNPGFCKHALQDPAKYPQRPKVSA